MFTLRELLTTSASCTIALPATSSASISSNELPATFNAAIDLVKDVASPSDVIA